MDYSAFWPLCIAVLFIELLIYAHRESFKLFQKKYPVKNEASLQFSPLVCLQEEAPAASS